MKSNNFHENKFMMIDHLHRVVKLILEIQIEFYPVTICLDLNNKIKLTDDIKTDDYPSNQEMIIRYEKKLNGQLKNKKILGYCIAYDAITAKDISGKKTDTIVFMTKYDPEKEAEITYYSYILNKYGKFEITDIWEEKRNLLVAS